MIRDAYVLSRPQKLYVICAAVFITALVVAEATASKLFTAFELPFTIHILGEEFSRVTMTAGVIAFPITFIVTDLMNEYFGKDGIRFVTFLGMVMIIFEFLILQVAMMVPTDPVSAVPEEAFDTVFGATGWIILGSLVAYLVGQLVDITLFHWLRHLTEGRYLWVRATGSTFGSQFLDTFLVLSIAFLPTGVMNFQTVVAVTLFNYLYKFVIAVVITPVIYLVHWIMDRYLGHETALEMIEQAAEASDVA